MYGGLIALAEIDLILAISLACKPTQIAPLWRFLCRYIANLSGSSWPAFLHAQFITQIADSQARSQSRTNDHRQEWVRGEWGPWHLWWDG